MGANTSLDASEFDDDSRFSHGSNGGTECDITPVPSRKHAARHMSRYDSEFDSDDHRFESKSKSKSKSKVRFSRESRPARSSQRKSWAERYDRDEHKEHDWDSRGRSTPSREYTSSRSPRRRCSSRWAHTNCRSIPFLGRWVYGDRKHHSKLSRASTISTTSTTPAQ